METDLSKGVGSWRVTLPGLTEHMQTIEPRSKMLVKRSDEAGRPSQCVWLAHFVWMNRPLWNTRMNKAAERVTCVEKLRGSAIMCVKFCLCIKNPEL